MKRFFLAISLLSSFIFVQEVSAIDFITPPYTVPYEYAGSTYTWVTQTQYDDMHSLIFYCKDTAGEPTIDFNYATQFYLRFGGGRGWSQSGYCRLVYTSNGGSSWSNINSNGYYIISYPNYNSFSLLRSNRNFIYNGYPSVSNYTNTNFGVLNINSGDILIPESSFAGGGPRQIHVSNSPQLGGGVSDYPAGENIYCGIDSYEICQASFSFNSQVTLSASPNEGYAFAYWEINDLAMADVDGEITIAMSENKVVKAVYNRTFQDAVDNFDVTTGDECVLYIRNETGIIYDACHGDAADCFEQAQMAGYATGSEPRESAIIVFDRVPDTALAVGHVGIVTSYNGDYVSIHDSNWVGYHTIGDHTELIGENGYNIKGYIYFAPHQ